MENLEVLKQFGVTSLEEARELAELTDRIVANLKAICGVVTGIQLAEEYLGAFWKYKTGIVLIGQVGVNAPIADGSWFLKTSVYSSFEHYTASEYGHPVDLNGE